MTLTNIKRVETKKAIIKRVVEKENSLIKTLNIRTPGKVHPLCSI